MDFSALWLQVPVLRRSQTQLPTSQGDAVDGVYMTQTTRPPSWDEPDATRPPTYATAKVEIAREVINIEVSFGLVYDTSISLTERRSLFMCNTHQLIEVSQITTQVDRSPARCDPTSYQDSLRRI